LDSDLIIRTQVAGELVNLRVVACLDLVRPEESSVTQRGVKVLLPLDAAVVLAERFVVLDSDPPPHGQTLDLADVP